MWFIATKRPNLLTARALTDLRVPYYMKFVMQASRYNITRIFWERGAREGLALSTPPSGITSQLYARAHSSHVRAVLRDSDAHADTSAVWPFTKINEPQREAARSHLRETRFGDVPHTKSIRFVRCPAGGGSFAEWRKRNGNHKNLTCCGCVYDLEQEAYTRGMPRSIFAPFRWMCK